MGRLVTAVLRKSQALQLAYVDDLHVVAWGEQKFKSLWMLLLAYEILGTPFDYHKFKGGLEVQFVGYELNYMKSTIGISKKRATWLAEFVKKIQKSSFTTSMRDFNEFLGRLGFVARVLTWIKPHLAPALDKSCAAIAPKLVRLVVLFIAQLVERLTGHQSCLRPLTAKQEEFRTDAKCEKGRVVLGGHHLQTGRWFILELLPEDAPFLFDEQGESSWASASAELLATWGALVAFGHLETLERKRVIPVVVSAGADNRSNEFLAKKRSTTAWPLMLINMSLSDALMKANLRLA